MDQDDIVAEVEWTLPRHLAERLGFVPSREQRMGLIVGGHGWQDGVYPSTVHSGRERLGE